jgi:hypothetical protein
MIDVFVCISILNLWVVSDSSRKAVIMRLRCFPGRFLRYFSVDLGASGPTFS